MKKGRAKTIQIHLPDGDPRGIKIAEVANTTVQAFFIPRGLVKNAKDLKEVKSVSLYFLFGNDEQDTRAEAYIGEAEVGYERLKQHNSKEFWEVAVLVVTNTRQNAFNKAGVKYLEHLAYNKAVEAGRYVINNKTIPPNPSMRDWDKLILEDLFETISLLLGTLGYPIFEGYRGEQEEDAIEDRDEELLFCTRNDTDAFGKYTGEGFIVYKGSKLSSSSTSQGFKSYLPKHNEKIQRFIADGILTEEEGRYIFLKDHPFTSPSAASTFVVQNKSNGKTAWKDKHGRTLDELLNL
ncbi:GIY-YIG nuclease family protein [Peribacillus frigoritolerans]